MRAFTRIEQPGKILLLFQPPIVHGVFLSGEMLSPLISPALKHFSASLGSHSLAETVHLASLSLLGLIRSFHDEYSCMICCRLILRYLCRFDYKDFHLFRQAISRRF